jgi:Reverse transcriptase (RNA-dependent DNA polymerase)
MPKKLWDTYVMVSHHKGVTYMTKLDQLGAFLQLPLDDESAAKTAFTTKEGRYEMTSLPFGFVNAPAIQQLFLADVLRSELGICAHVYLDDVLVYTRKGFAHHLATVRRVMKAFRSRGVSLKRSVIYRHSANQH